MSRPSNSRGKRSERHDAFAVCPPGVEDLTAAELQALGARTGRQVRGGVSFQASTRQLYAANLWVRTATRLVVRAGRFEATNLHDFERRIGRIDLSRWIQPGETVRVRVSARRTRLSHTGAVAERVLAGTGTHPVVAASSDLSDAAVGADEHEEFPDIDDGSNESTIDEQGEEAPPTMLVVRIVGDRCTLSVDTSGEALHRRGWRLALGKAPLRPTLAASALLASGWKGERALVDPFCGSGTICIEAALIACGRPPGANRPFGFASWPSFEPGTWASVLGEAQQREQAAAVSITGTDRDRGVIDNAIDNARRAGVDEVIDFAEATLSTFEPPVGGGLVVTNPPWGERLEGGDLRNLHARLGDVVRAADGWDATLITGDARSANHSGLSLRPVLRTESGGRAVKVLTTVTAHAEPAT